MTKFSKLALVVGTVSAAPALVGAQQIGAPLVQTVGLFNSIVNSLSAIMPVVAVLVFAMGVVWYVWKKMTGGEVENKVLLWGVIALAVLFSLSGIIRLLQNIVGATGNDSLKPPVVAVPVRR
jgi:hypothetical protein